MFPQTTSTPTWAGAPRRGGGWQGRLKLTNDTKQTERDIECLKCHIYWNMNMDQYASWKLALDSRKMWKGFLFVYRHIYMFRISYVRIDVCVCIHNIYIYIYLRLCTYVGITKSQDGSEHGGSPIVKCSKLRLNWHTHISCISNLHIDFYKV